MAIRGREKIAFEMTGEAPTVGEHLLHPIVGDADTVNPVRLFAGLSTFDQLALRHLRRPSAPSEECLTCTVSSLSIGNDRRVLRRNEPGLPVLIVGSAVNWIRTGVEMPRSTPPRPVRIEIGEAGG